MAIRVRLSALVIASAFALVGCGGGSGSDEGVADLSATKTIAAAKKQLADEKFVTLKGKGEGPDAGSEMTVDMSFAGETASGSIGVSGMTIQLLKSGGKSYFKADKSFFESSGVPADALAALGDKWVIMNAADPSFAEMGNFLSRETFLGEILKSHGKVTKGKEKKVNGVDCVSLKDDEGTLYLDKKNARPISIVSSASDGKGTLDFSYDKVAEAKAPSSDEVFDLATLDQ